MLALFIVCVVSGMISSAIKDGGENATLSLTGVGSSAGPAGAVGAQAGATGSGQQGAPAQGQTPHGQQSGPFAGGAAATGNTHQFRVCSSLAFCSCLKTQFLSVGFDYGFVLEKLRVCRFSDISFLFFSSPSFVLFTSDYGLLCSGIPPLDVSDEAMMGMVSGSAGQPSSAHAHAHSATHAQTQAHTHTTPHSSAAGSSTEMAPTSTSHAAHPVPRAPIAPSPLSATSMPLVWPLVFRNRAAIVCCLV